jgi:hypothetical protein
MAARSGELSLELAREFHAEHQALYGDLVRDAVASQTAFLRRAISAERAGAVIARVATASRPRPRYTLGADAAVVVPLARHLPTRVLDAALVRRRGG